MLVVSRKTKAAAAVARWEYQYRGSGRLFDGRKPADILKRLKALGDNPDPDAVDAAIGGEGWTCRPQCDECGEANDVVIQLGQEPDYESATASICPACLKKALELASNA
jgi:hypothetical protein